MDDVSDLSEREKLINTIDDRFDVYSLMPPWKFGSDNKFNIALQKVLRKKPKYIYNIHNDMEICNDNLIEKLVLNMEENNNCGSIGPTIYNANGKKTWGKDIVKIRMGKEYINNETYMVRSKCYLEMGLINPRLHYYGTEYYVFNWLRDNGYSCAVLDDVSVIHYAGRNRGTSHKFQNQKDYYRPRTSILIMKLFCKEDSFKRKLRYFYHELGEPRMKMRKFIKNFQFISLIRTMFLLFIGTIAGLVIPIKLNKPYKVDESS